MNEQQALEFQLWTDQNRVLGEVLALHQDWVYVATWGTHMCLGPYDNGYYDREPEPDAQT